MPLQLFTNICNSGASVGTCILVFKAHQPHKYFLEDGGRTFLADWREDGLKIIAKHGRFEDKNRWFTANTGYRDMYLKDMNNTIGRDTFSKEITLRDAYNTAFPEEKISEQATMIPSSLFNKDIHDGGIKSIGIRIFDNPHTVEIQKIDKDEEEIILVFSDFSKVSVVKVNSEKYKKFHKIDNEIDYIFFQEEVEEPFTNFKAKVSLFASPKNGNHFIELNSQTRENYILKNGKLERIELEDIGGEGNNRPGLDILGLKKSETLN